MSDFLRRALFRLGIFAGHHPDDADLLPYQDGELSPFKHWCIKIHLAGCASCRASLGRVEEELRTFQSREDQMHARTGFELAKGAENLRRAIWNWESVRMAQPVRQTAGRFLTESLLRRVETEFDLYLGNHATAAIILKLKTGNGTRQSRLAEAESVLSDFLGPRAASAVTQRIVHLQMSADGRAHGSPAA